MSVLLSMIQRDIEAHALRSGGERPNHLAISEPCLRALIKAVGMSKKMREQFIVGPDTMFMGMRILVSDSLAFNEFIVLSDNKPTKRYEPKK